MIYIPYIILLAAYWYAPKTLKVVAFLLNLVIPDPIPYVDEIIMVAGLIKDSNQSGR